MKLSKFQEAWSNAKKSIFRLEALPKYKIEYDLNNFKEFKKGESYIGLKERNWFKQIRKAKQKRIKIQRVRIVSLPFSSYLKYEIDFWQHSIKYGEKVLFLQYKDYKKIKSVYKFKPKDFWMFDDRTLIIFHYNPRGEWVKEEKIVNNKIINNYRKLKNKLIKYSIPMHNFLKNLKK